MQRICIAMTGASGAPYALRLIEVLLKQGHAVDLLISKAAQLVLATETGLALGNNPRRQVQELQQYFQCQQEQLVVYGREDWMAPWASGSGQPGPVVVCPCSTGTLSAIATGASNNLIERAADVALKERRKLILVPRETPFSEIHLQNMLTLTRMGAVIMPACPGFYHEPQSIDDLVDFMVARILSQLGIEQNIMQGWGSGYAPSKED